MSLLLFILLTLWDVTGVLGCGGILNDTSGNFNSPGFPNKYGDFESCEWTIQVTKDNVIEVVFNSFSLERKEDGCGSCDCDFVTLDDHLGGIDPSVRYCADTIPSSFVSCGSKLTVTFRSDEVGTYPGFTASYTMRNPNSTKSTGNCTAEEEFSTSEVISTELGGVTQTTESTTTGTVLSTTVGSLADGETSYDATESTSNGVDFVSHTSSTVTGERNEAEPLPFGLTMAVGIVTGMAAAGVIALMIEVRKVIKAGEHLASNKVTPDRNADDRIDDERDEDRRSVMSLPQDSQKIRVMPMGIYLNYVTVPFTIEDKGHIKRHTMSLKKVSPLGNKPQLAVNLHFDPTTSC